MTDLAAAAGDYLDLRRALGYKLPQAGGLLNAFVEYLQGIGAPSITTKDALAWAMAPTSAEPAWWANRLSVVRGFALYLQTLDPSTQVPPTGLIPHPNRRTTPYIYSPAEIAALLGAARRLLHPFRAATYETFFALMAATGMRNSETRDLDRGDVDFTAGELTVVHGKFDKTRLLPLHPSTLDALHRYALWRDKSFPRPKDPSFFISTEGTRLIRSNVNRTFRQLLTDSAITWAPRKHQPRPHDLRHTFAVTTILNWYRGGVDVQAHLPLLSTYLGHVLPADTYWYLTTVPELLTLVADRLERAGAQS